MSLNLEENEINKFKDNLIVQNYVTSEGENFNISIGLSNSRVGSSIVIFLGKYKALGLVNLNRIVLDVYSYFQEIHPMVMESKPTWVLADSSKEGVEFTTLCVPEFIWHEKEQEYATYKEVEIGTKLLSSDVLSQPFLNFKMFGSEKNGY